MSCFSGKFRQNGSSRNLYYYFVADVFLPEETKKKIPRPRPAIRSKLKLVSIGTTRPGGGGTCPPH